MTAHTGPGPHPLVGRQRHLVVALRIALAAGAVGAVLGTAAGGAWRDAGAAVFIATLVVAPLGRLLWLIARWVRRGDLRFAAAASALLGVVAVAASTTWW